MAEFKYKAIDADGKITAGALAADDKKSASAILASMGLKPITIKTLAEGDSIEIYGNQA